MKELKGFLWKFYHLGRRSSINSSEIPWSGKNPNNSNIFLNWITNVTFGIHFEINYCFLFVVLSVCFLHFVKQGNKMKLLCFLLILLCV